MERSRAMKDLKKITRDRAIYRHYTEGAEADDLADMWGISLSTVYRAIRRNRIPRFLHEEIALPKQPNNDNQKPVKHKSIIESFNETMKKWFRFGEKI
jgi:transposase